MAVVIDMQPTAKGRDQTSANDCTSPGKRSSACLAYAHEGSGAITFACPRWMPSTLSAGTERRAA